MKPSYDETLPALPTRKRKGEGHERREEILEVATRLFVEEGYEATTIRRVASALGLCSTALYVYFPDKDAILREICARTFTELTQNCGAVRDGEGDPVSKLERATCEYIRFGLRHPHAYLLTFNDPHLPAPAEGDPKSSAGTDDDPGERAFASFQSLVRDVVQTGVAREGDVVGLTQCLWAGMHGLVSLLVLRPHFAWIEREALIRRHVDLLLRGLLRPDAGCRAGGLVATPSVTGGTPARP